MIVSNILVGIVNKLQDFRTVQMSHVKHQGNKPAHILTKYTKEIKNRDNYVTWIEKNPHLIELAVTHDIMNLSYS